MMLSVSPNSKPTKTMLDLDTDNRSLVFVQLDRHITPVMSHPCENKMKNMSRGNKNHSN